MWGQFSSASPLHAAHFRGRAAHPLLQGDKRNVIASACGHALKVSNPRPQVLDIMASALLGNLLSDVALHELALELRKRALDVAARQRCGAHHAHAQAAHKRAQQPAARLGLGRP